MFVDAEDYLPVTSTYPEHPLSKVNPNARNIEELKSKRLVEYKVDVDKKNGAFEAHRASLTKPKSYVPSEFFGTNKYTSINQRVDEEKRNARKSVGLTETMQDNKDNRERPGLRYVSAPPVKSKQILEQKRKAEALNDLKKFEKNFE